MVTLTKPAHLPDPPKDRTVVRSLALGKSSMERLGTDVDELFGRSLDVASLLHMSKSIQTEMRKHLRASSQCMLPSFNYELPTGQEQGLYLALEVGGSNLRMAMVELRGRLMGAESIRIRQTLQAPIDQRVRQLPDCTFFDWMAGNIRQLLHLEEETRDRGREDPPLRMAVAWSFPIEFVWKALARRLAANTWTVKPQCVAATCLEWERAFIARMQSEGMT